MTQGGWAAALTGLCAHWVPSGWPQGGIFYGRPTGLTLEGYYALIDKQGLAEGGALPQCPTCREKLDALLAAVARPDGAGHG